MISRKNLPLLLLAVLFIAGPAWLVFAESSKPQETTDQILLKRIETLETRVKELEQKLQNNSTLQFTPVPNAGLAPHLAPNPIPKNWQQKEFNGVPYYVIPLEGSTSQPTSTQLQR